MIRGCGGFDVGVCRVYGGFGDCVGGSDSFCDGVDYIIVIG